MPRSNLIEGRGPLWAINHLILEEEFTIRFMLTMVDFITERGVHIELPHHRDSTDRWSAKDKVGTSCKPPAKVWAKISCGQVTAKPAG